MVVCVRIEFLAKQIPHFLHGSAKFYKYVSHFGTVLINPIDIPNDVFEFPINSNRFTV